MKKNIMKNKFMRNIILVGLLLIPLMYSYFYLKAFWNPYGNIDKITVAIVNLDETVDNTNKGNELVSKLEKENVLDLKLVTLDEANKGLINKKYYAVITIPKDFTKNIKNVEDGIYNQTVITYSPNQKTNYLASQIISRIVSSIENDINTEINTNITSNLVYVLKKVPSSLEEVVTGFNEIETNLAKISSGTNSLKTGLKKLNSGYIKFDNGLNTLNSGSNKITSSMNSLNNGIVLLNNSLSILDSVKTKISILTVGVDTLKKGSDEYTIGFNSYVSSVDNIATSSELMADCLKTSSGGSIDLSSLVCQNALYAANQIDSNKINSIKLGGSTLKDSNVKINTGISNLNSSLSGLSSIEDNLTVLTTSISSLNSGSNLINSGLKNLNIGISEITTNSSVIKGGINSSYNGINKLNNGVNDLYKGLSTASSSLEEKVEKTKASTDKLNNMNKYVKEPVTIKEKKVNSVSKYGIAFAPYFMSISLWVGSLMLLVVLFYDLDDRFKIFSRTSKKTNKRMFAYLGMAALQGISLGFILKIGLGFEINNYLLYYSSLVLVSCTFSAIIQFLVYCFKDVGKFLGILFLVLQLSSSAGTFPIETVPSFFQKLYNFMPMKYSINLIKEALISNEENFVLINGSILFGIMTFFVISIIVVDYFKNKKNN